MKYIPVLQYLLLVLLSFVVVTAAAAFVVSYGSPQSPHTHSFELAATKKKVKKKRSDPASSSSSFGGARMEPCPCSAANAAVVSEPSYAQCCGMLHTDMTALKQASPSQVVRARYAAYAKKQADFLMATTHPYQKDFDPDLKRWKQKIKENMYDNFELPRCTIVSEQLQGDTKATVVFIAELVLKETGEVTSFMETAELERASTDGRWLYLNGTIENVPDTIVANVQT